MPILLSAAFRNLRVCASVSPGPLDAASPGAPAAPVTAGSADQRLDRVRAHLRRYRDLAAQGKWADAGKELEAIEAEVH